METLKIYTIKHRRDNGITRFCHFNGLNLRRAAQAYASWAGYGTVAKIHPGWDGVTQVWLTGAKYPLEIKR